MDEEVRGERKVPKFSVVVPVYNVERYLHTCVDSILQQKFADFELILVDDGSSDMSGKICDNYAKLDERVKVFHIENSGVSVARNLGIEKATGKWISFIDSDDFIENNYFEACLEDENPDLIYFGFTACFEEETRTSYFLPKKVPVDYIFFLKVNQQHHCYFGYTWNKFFRLEIIKNNNLRFCPNLSMHEDELFTLQYCSFVRSISFSQNLVYNYRILSTGLTGRVRINAGEFELLADEYTKAVKWLREGKSLFLYRKEIYMLYLHACIIATSITYRWKLCRKLHVWAKGHKLDLACFGRTEKLLVKQLFRIGTIGLFVVSLIMKKLNLERWI